MVGLWLATLLCTSAPPGESALEADGLSGERVAVVPRDRKPPSHDLKDPFDPETYAFVPFHRPAHDLKDPFAPDAEPSGRAPATVRADLYDPFDDRDGESLGSCRSRKTTEGVVIQRPKAFERPCQRTSRPLRDPFSSAKDP